MTGVVVGEDGITRCAWSASTPEYRAYHDDEWGRPVTDDKRVFEKLCLEGFQAGLSWLTILRKREALRDAFAGFDPGVVAAFDERDIERLLSNPGIVRHRRKIAATITNARATLRLADEGLSLAGLCWTHEPKDAPVPEGADALAGCTPESTVLSADLRRRGFAFVGPTTVYAAMQSLGIVNDHMLGCPRRAVIDTERRRLRRPALERARGRRRL